MTFEADTILQRAPWQYYLVRLPSTRSRKEVGAILEQHLSTQSLLVTAQVTYLGTLGTRRRWKDKNLFIDRLLAKRHSGVD
jgi:hypothetical protein